MIVSYRSGATVLRLAAAGGQVMLLQGVVALAAELGRDGVRVNAVSPCLVDDDQHLPGGTAGVPPTRAAAAAPTAAPEVGTFLEATAKRTPLRRLARPDDVAAVIVALGSPDFGLVTGEVVRVDGGYSLLA